MKTDNRVTRHRDIIIGVMEILSTDGIGYFRLEQSFYLTTDFLTIHFP